MRKLKRTENDVTLLFLNISYNYYITYLRHLFAMNEHMEVNHLFLQN